MPDFGSPLDSNVKVTFNLVSKDTGDPVVGKVYVGNYESRRRRSRTPTRRRRTRGSTSTAMQPPPSHPASTTSSPSRRATGSSGSMRRSTGTDEDPDRPDADQLGLRSGRCDGDRRREHAGAAIDETELTNWNADGRAADGTLSGIAGKQITIDLAGTRPGGDQRRGQRDDRANAEPLLRPAVVRALGVQRQLGRGLLHRRGLLEGVHERPDAFPGDAPRPNGPQLILRNFNTGEFRATHVRLRVLTNQCTGGPAYQGEQDADPAPQPTATRTCRLAHHAAASSAPPRSRCSARPDQTSS